MKNACFKPELRCRVVTQPKICINSIRALRRKLRSKDYDIIFHTTSKLIPNAAFAAIGKTSDRTEL